MPNTAFDLENWMESYRGATELGLTTKDVAEMVRKNENFHEGGLPKSRIMPNACQLIWLSGFILLTALLGLALRWQMAGASIPWLSGLDIRRAHSHLGFYGVLFPATWITLSSLGSNTPGRRTFFFYCGFALLSTVGFLFWGYGILAITSSTAVLFVWLHHAWKNQSHQRLLSRNWMGASALSIYISAILIGAVAISTRTQPELANKLARSFLTLLLFGVFIPSALNTFTRHAPVAITWFFGIVSGAIYLTELSTHWFFGVGLVSVGLEISRALWKTHIDERQKNQYQIDRRILCLWAIFAGSLIATGLGLLPYSYFSAIAGIHYLILGPLLMTFAITHLRLELGSVLRMIYEGSFLTMVASIALKAVAPQHFQELQHLAAISGSLLVISMILIIIRSVATRKTSLF